MKSYEAVLKLSAALSALTLALVFAPLALHAQGQSTAQVHLVITNEAVHGDGEVPKLQQGDVKVKQGKSFLKVDQLIPAQGDNAALQLFILIDDTLDSGVNNNLNDIRDFINAQPATTIVGIGYMSNATVQVLQDFTADHAAAAKAIRIPLGTLSTMDSPYLSLISLVKGWPEQKVRREVIIVTDGIDRLRGNVPSRSAFGPGFGPAFHSMPTISPDVDSASEISQRYNVIVYPLYAVGVGRVSRSFWDLQNGLTGLTKLADETGGDCFSLGTSNAVSFRPYLDRLQKMLNNQYYAVFQAVPKKKAGLQRVNLSTEVPNSEIAVADNVWVPAGAAK
jgi:hypothetical protein